MSREPNSTSTPFEIARFYLALSRVLESKHQLLGYMREAIKTETGDRYLSISDEEVKAYLQTLNPKG